VAAKVMRRRHCNAKARSRPDRMCKKIRISRRNGGKSMKLTTRLMLASAAVAFFAATPAIAQTTLSAYWNTIYNTTGEPQSAPVMTELMAEYKKLKPDVTVNNIDNMNDVNAYQAWLTTRFTGGDQPDITWQQFYQRNAEKSELWLPLNDYLEKPNPYVPEGQPGHDRWADQFYPNVLAQIRAGDGNWYQVNTDWVETGFYTNTDLLSANGVDPASWKTWGDMIQSCKDLRAKGIQPMGVFMTPEWSTYQWLDDIIVTGAWADQIQGWYMDKYSSEYLPWRQLNQEEFAKAVKEGKFSVNDPRFDTYLKLTKDVADNCLVKGFAGIAQYDDVFKLFHDGTVAMAWLGSWTAPSLAELPFKVGSTYLPPFGKDDSPYEVNTTSYRVGGPSSAGQFGLTAITKERGTVDAAIDLLMFITAPQNYQKIANVVQGNIPVINGVNPPEAAKGFQEIAKLPERGLTDPIGRLSQEFGSAHNRLFQSFMIGEMTADDLKVQYQKELDRAVEDLCEANAEEWTWCAE
jgi:ABC-type glycerol-3-phosphate transport system substrate-binding protein